MDEYYAVIRSKNELTHYGIPGMQWGVRRYFNKQGQLTKKANKRYGKNPTKTSSAHRMSFDYNSLNQSAANFNADINDYRAKKQSYIDKINRKTDKYLSKHPLENAREVKRGFSKKYSKKIDKLNREIKTSNMHMKGAKDLQKKILKAAKKNNYYDTDKKEVTWYGISTKNRRGLTAAQLGLGMIGNAMYTSSIMADKSHHYKAPRANFKKSIRR